jgi:ABC-2 type transport system ATP-binding protein
VLEVMERLRKHTTIFYSTHILSDVQRVSDTVAILNHGRLVAEAPIGQLLAGSGATVYQLSLRGDGQAARARVANQPWVSALEVEAGADGQVRWQVSVTDAEAAEAELQRLVLQDPRVRITGFGRKQWDLEEVFLRLVEEPSPKTEGRKNGRKR